MTTADPHRPDWRLACTGLSVQRGGRLVLRGVELALGPGQCVNLIGPNGSGKSTLMLALLGLLPPAAGRVVLDGRPMHRLAPRRRGRFAAYVPQLVERLPGFTVYDVVAGGRFPHVPPLRPLSPRDRQMIARTLAQCGLLALAGRPVNAVSAGERQKALLAAALAQDAELLCLDEPNTALDPAYQVELVRLLRDWQARRRALLLISHDLNFPAVLGGRVLALRGGVVVADGPAAEVLQPARLREVYGTQFELATTPEGRRVLTPRWEEGQNDKVARGNNG